MFLIGIWSKSEQRWYPLSLCVFPLQIIEENGVRRVLVLPQQPEFHPVGHSTLHHAHLPAFIPHPAMMPHLYTGMAGGVGDMSAQYISQYHPAHIYSEQGELEQYCYIKTLFLCPQHFICTVEFYNQGKSQTVKSSWLFISGALPQYCPVVYIPFIVTLEFAIYWLFSMATIPGFIVYVFVSTLTHKSCFFCPISLSRFSLPSRTPAVCSQRRQN